MAGDHKCPVCNSTFTRPQHVARHMRSHTGDRPYKCQHCGDQFARSDLLSRHVNKCHASEKPPTTTAPNRRKGPTAASRATTSKQACDQCVQSSLPCDGCNPCTKCVSRKYRCTYVKFHRQTAPQGPGHPPPSQLLQHNSHSTLAAASIAATHPSLPPLSSQYNPIQYPHLAYSQQYPGPVGHSRTSSTSSGGGSTRIPGLPDDFLLNSHHASGSANLAAMGLSASAPYSSGAALMDYPGYPGYSPEHQRESPTPSLTTTASTASTTSVDPLPVSDVMARYRQQVDLYNRSGLSMSVPVSSSMNLHMMQQDLYDQQQHGTVGGNQREAWAGQSFHDAAAKDDSTTGAIERGIPFPSVQAHSTSRDRAGHHGDDGDVRPSTGRTDRSEGFSSAFGLMSLDDPAVLAGLANDGEPFFSSVHHQRGQSEESDGRDIHMQHSDASSNASDVSVESSGTSGSHASSNTSLSSFGSMNFGSSGTTPLATKEEMKEFWRQYMRTPLTGPGGGLFPNLATPIASGSHLQLGHGHEAESSTPPQRPGFGTPGRRHSRVSSLPSLKTPGVSNEWNLFSTNNSGTQQGGSSSNTDWGFSGVPQSQPFKLTLNPRRNKDVSLSSTTHASEASYPSNSKAGTNHSDDLKSYEQAVLARKAPTQLNLVPKRRGTIHLGAVGGGLQQAQAHSNFIQQQTRQAQVAQAHQQLAQDERDSHSAFGGKDHGPDRRDADSPTPGAGMGANSTGLLGQPASSSMSPPPVPASASSAASYSPTLSSYRPSFKRLASQTLAPENAKRALLGPAGWDDGEEDGDGLEDGGATGSSEGSEEDAAGAHHWSTGAVRRMSASSEERSGSVMG